MKLSNIRIEDFLEEGKENLSPYRPTRKFQVGDIIRVVGELESLEVLMANR